MATLTLVDTNEMEEAIAPAGSGGLGSGGLRLREWLGGRWAVLFSNPEDFAPHPSTPEGFITLLAEDFAACGAQPITLARSDEPAPSWLDFAGADSSRVVLNSSATGATPENSGTARIVDLAERTLATTIRRLSARFVIVLDANARCRTTISYDARRGERVRTIQDILTVVQVLQRRAPEVARKHYDRVAAG